MQGLKSGSVDHLKSRIDTFFISKFRSSKIKGLVFVLVTVVFFLSEIPFSFFR